MDHKEIQRKRIMDYFINAAKEIIKEEGVKGLTVRKVGDKAGYSYATIYNYFNDLKTLMAYCAFDFLEDCYKYMLSFKDNSVNPVEQVIIYSSAYLKYFAENPNLFQLIFLEELGDPPKDLLEDNKPSVGFLLEDKLLECSKQGYISKDDVKILKDIIGFLVNGKLLFHLNNRNQFNIDEMIKSIEREIKYLIKMR